MSQAKKGDTVKVHYTGTLEDGTVFDSSREREPLQFELGAGNLIPGFENAVLGMETGESKSVDIPADEAYGAYNADLLVEIGRERLPDNLEPEVGQRLETVQNDGRKILVTVAKVADDSVTLDANHPLAGKDLKFDIELQEIL